MEYLKKYENFNWHDKLPMVKITSYGTLCFKIDDVDGEFPKLYYTFGNPHRDRHTPFIEWISDIGDRLKNVSRLDKFLIENPKWIYSLEDDFNNPMFSSGGKQKSLDSISDFKKNILIPLLDHLDWLIQGNKLGLY